MRFASREKAILSQFEVGAGVVPGGGPMARLPRLMGRGRALEVLLGADDVPGDLAEVYGYVNRSLPDSDLDAFVDALATRIASFDKQAISETKHFVDVASLPPDFEIAPEWDVCLASIMRPAAQERIRKLMERGFHQAGEIGFADQYPHDLDTRTKRRIVVAVSHVTEQDAVSDLHFDGRAKWQAHRKMGAHTRLRNVDNLARSNSLWSRNIGHRRCQIRSIAFIKSPVHTY